MKPGTVLRLYQQIQRIRGTMNGITVSATDAYIRIETPDMVALYNVADADYVLHEAQQWPVGGTLEDLLP